MVGKKLNDQAIFEVARKIGMREARQTYLHQVCGDDLAMLQRVEALLKAHDDSASFLEGPPPGISTSPTINQLPFESAGAQIGPYKLLQQIGEGGMGTVYMAEQSEPVQRRVAIKIIKPGMDSRQVIARFEAEKQALAMMDHANIARVLDAGTTDQGRPYFVMELVHGVPITKYCDDNRLTPRQRLELFVPVCQAIQHAHQKGIIHRDIKPSNVMVTLYDGKPVPKVIDFGVAKATEQRLTEQTLFTQYGTMVGTLEYMSPEQAEMSALGVDTRSDVYSLGVLLYELLTGSTPLTRQQMKEAAYGEILRLIKEKEPPKPSTRLSESGDSLASISALRHTEPAKLSKLLRGELDWIVMKTLEKDRNRRYETANGFAADVQRYLNDEPVQACPPSATYRFRKFARRNKVLLITASLVTVALVLGVAGTTWQAIRASWQRDRAVDAENLAQTRLEAETRARNDADEQRRRAEEKSAEAARNLREARKAVDDWFTKISQTTLLDAPGLQPLRHELLEAALNYYQGLQKQAQDNPELRADLAAAHLRLSVIYISLDRNDDALAAMLQGFELVEQLFQAQPNDKELPKQLAGYFKSSRQLFQRTRPPSDPLKAIETLQRAAERWEQFSRDNPSLPELQGDLAGMYLLLGALFQSKDLPKSLAYAVKSRELLEKLVNSAPDAAAYNELLVLSFTANADVLSQQQDTAAAEAMGRRAIEYFEKLVREHPDAINARLSFTRLQHALASRIRLSSPQATEGLFRQEIELLERSIAQSPTNAHFRQQLYVALESLADHLQRDGRAEGAEDLHNKAMAVNEKLILDYPNSPDFRQEYAKSFITNGNRWREDQPQRAESAYRRAIKIQEQLVVDFPSDQRLIDDLIHSQTRLATLLQQSDKTAELETLYREIIAGSQRMVQRSPNSSQFALLLAKNTNRLGIALRNAGKRTDADAELANAQKLWQRSGSFAVDKARRAAEAEPVNGHRWHDLFVAHYDAGDWENCLRAVKKKQDINNGGSAWEFFHEAMAHWQLDQRNEALAKYLAAIDWMDATNESQPAKLRGYQADAAMLLGLPDPAGRVERALELHKRGNAFQKAGQTEQAKTAYGGAIDIYESLSTDFPAVLSYTRKLLELYTKCGRESEMEQVYRRAIAAREKLSAGTPNLRLEHANRCNDLAFLLFKAGKYADAESFVRKAIELKQALASEFPQTPNYRFHLAHSYLGLGTILAGTNRAAEAVDANTAAGSIFLALAPDDAESAEFRQWNGHALWQLGDAWLKLNRLEESRRAFEQARKTFQQLAKEQPSNRYYRQEQGYSYRLLANVAERSDRIEEGEQYLGAALQFYQDLVKEDAQSAHYRSEVAHVQWRLGSLLLRLGKLTEADSAFAETIRLQPEMARGIAQQHLDLARQIAEKDIAAAEPVYERAISSYEQLVAQSPESLDVASQLASSLVYRAIVFEKKNQPAQAEAFFLRGVTIWKTLSEKAPENEWYRQERAHFGLALANVLQSTGQLEAALAHRRTSVGLNEKLAADFARSPHHLVRLVEARGALIGSLALLGHAEAAKAEVETLLQGKPSAQELNSAAWNIVRQAGAPVQTAHLAADMASQAVQLSPTAGHIWNTLGIAQFRAGQRKEAIAALQKSAELRKGGDSSDWFFLAMAHWQLDEKDEARRWLGKAIEWADANAKDNFEMKGFRDEAANLISDP